MTTHSDKYGNNDAGQGAYHGICQKSFHVISCNEDDCGDHHWQNDRGEHQERKMLICQEIFLTKKHGHKPLTDAHLKDDYNPGHCKHRE